MARLFDDASSEYLEVDSAPVTAVAFSISCWFYTDQSTGPQWLVALADKDAGDQYHGLYLANSTRYLNAHSRQAGTQASAQITATQPALNTWQHACGVWGAADSRIAYLNGGDKTTDATSASPTGIDRLSVGRIGDSSPGGYFSGRLAEVGIWNVALTDSEVAALAAGASPLRIRPGSLVGYWPVYGVASPEIDYTGGRTLAVTGTTAADHAPVAPPFWASYLTIGAAAGGGTAYVKNVSELLLLHEASLALNGLLRSVAEALGLYEAVSKFTGFARSVAELLGIGESTRASLSLRRFAAESVQALEGVGRSLALSRSVAELVSVYEAIGRRMAMVRFGFEVVAVREAIASRRAILAAIAELLGITEAPGYAKTLLRYIGEVVNIGEAVNKVGTLLRYVAETVNVTEVAYQAGAALIQFANETLQLIEARLPAMWPVGRRSIAILRDVRRLLVKGRAQAGALTYGATEYGEGVYGVELLSSHLGANILRTIQRIWHDR